MMLVGTATYAADANGTWTWTQQARGGGGGEGRKMTLKLKAEGEKLTGTLTAPGREGAEPRPAQISEGKVKGDEVTFNVTREIGGNSMTAKYSGKVAGDTLKGKITTTRNGEERARDWEAKREK